MTKFLANLVLILMCVVSIVYIISLLIIGAELVRGIRGHMDNTLGIHDEIERRKK